MKRFRKIIKIIFVLTLVLSWLLTGWPQIKNTRAAVTRGATYTTFTATDATTAVSFSHTVDADTTLLIVVVSQEADETVISGANIPYWNTTEAFTLIHYTTSSAAAGDMMNSTWGLVNPSTGTHNITYTQSSDDWAHSTAVNYKGTETASVEVATNYLNEKVNNSASTTTVLASAGTTGATLFAAAVFYGGDGDPSTNATSFAELADSATGTDTALDMSFYVADLIGGAPAAITVDWYSTASDENAGQLIEILPLGMYQWSPTVELNSPANASSDSDTTPTLNFTGTDGNADTIEYNVQIATDDTFSSGAITRVQYKYAYPATSGTGYAFASNNTLHNFIVVIVSGAGTSTSMAISDTQGNTYTALTLNNTDINAQMFYAADIKSGANSVKATYTGWSDVGFMAVEYSGIATSNPLDVEATPVQIDTATKTCTSNSFNPQTGSLIFAAWANESADPGTATGSGMTVFSPSNSHYDVQGENLSATTGSQTISFNLTNTSSGFWIVNVAAFKSAGGGSLLLSKFSKTDTGFLDYPDEGDTHPFTSGTAITYTVQSALDAGTYYWRVAGIDEGGSNTYGAWSSTRSFTISNAPSLDSPADMATGQSVTPTLKTTATDPESDYIMYKIVICTNVGMSTGCQTFSQTADQTNWIGQNTQNSTAYTSGTQGVLIVPNTLNNDTTYYWDSYAIDPGGSNTYSSTQGTPRSFTTQASTALNSQNKGVIMQGVILR